MAAFLIFRPYYLSDDDSQMSLIASGWGGQGPSEFLVCINVILGFILKWLYTLWPGFTWYGFLHFLLFFLSTWTVLALLLEKRPFTGPWVAVLGVQAAAFIHYFSHVEFTITAFLAAQAGVLLLLARPPEKAGRIRPFLAGGLFLVGSLIRIQAAFLALAACAVLGADWWMHHSPRHRWRAVAPLLMAAATAGALHLGSDHYYNSNPDWGYSSRLIAAYHDILEYRKADTEKDMKGGLEKAGLDFLDLSLFGNFYWQDPKLNPTNLSELEENLPPHWARKGFGWIWILKNDYFVQVQLMAFIPLFFCGRNRQKWILMGALWIPVLLLVLFYFMRLTPWVVWPLFSLGPIAGFIQYGKWGASVEPVRPGNWLRGAEWAVAVFCILFASLLIASDWKENQGAIAREKQLFRETDALGFKPDKLYVTWNHGFPFADIGVFGKAGFLRNIPVYWLDAWQYVPSDRNLLAKFNLKDPFRDMVNRPDVFFILPENYSTMYNLYLRNRCHIDPTFQWVFHGTLFDVYQVVGKPLPEKKDTPG